jgi:hypothetical protein
LLCALSALSASFAHADQNVFTPTNGRACADHSRGEFGWWRCPGSGRYAAEFADEGNLAAASIWMPSHAPKATNSITWRGAGRVFGEQWPARCCDPPGMAHRHKLGRSRARGGGTDNSAGFDRRGVSGRLHRWATTRCKRNCRKASRRGLPASVLG